MPAKHNPGDIKARKKWDGENLLTVGTKVRKETAEAFKTACALNGESMHAVLKRAIEEYIESHQAL